MIKYQETQIMKDKKSIFSTIEISDKQVNAQNRTNLIISNYIHTSDRELESDIHDFMTLNKIYDINSIKLFIGRHLSWLALDQNVEYIMSYLINKKNLNINYQEEELFDNTILMAAIANAENPIGLINLYNADPFIRDIVGKNSLHLIIAKGHKKKNPSHRREDQRPLFNEILLSKNLKDHIDDQDKFGNTALHIAAAKRDMDYLKPLIENGANLDIKNKDCLSVIDVLKQSLGYRFKVLSSILNLKEDNKKINIPEKASLTDDDYKNLFRGLDDFNAICSFDRERFEQDPLRLLKEIKSLRNPRNKPKEEDIDCKIKLVCCSEKDLKRGTEEKIN